MKLEFLKANVFKTKASDLESIVLIGSPKDFEVAKNLTMLPGDWADRLSKHLKKKKSEVKAGFSLHFLSSEDDQPNISIFVVSKDLSGFERLGEARKIVASALKPETKTLGVALLPEVTTSEWADALGAAVEVRCFLMPVYGKRESEQKKFSLQTLLISSQKDFQKNFFYGRETGAGANLVRSLGTTPSNFLNPEIYGKKIQKLAQDYRLKCRFYSKADLKKMKAGAFLAVNQGDPDSKGGIYELTYSPRGAKNKKPIALVGKGLCFDTGGYDIKTGGYMATMKGDMTGSAVALSTLLTAARLKLPVHLKAFLALTENHISPEAYKADDVVYAMNGRSIEVVNTDAEGRMVLADTLCLASRAKPQMIIDYATLTGTAVFSIGTSYSAGFTNSEKLHTPIVEAGKLSGERVWTFPTDKDFDKHLKSPVADTLQCSRARGIDHILAARFLGYFVDEGIDWVHIDLSAAENKGGLAHVDSEFTGFGIRWSLEFLKSQLKFKV